MRYVMMMMWLLLLLLMMMRMSQQQRIREPLRMAGIGIAVAIAIVVGRRCHRRRIVVVGLLLLRGTGFSSSQLGFAAAAADDVSSDGRRGHTFVFVLCDMPPPIQYIFNAPDDHRLRFRRRSFASSECCNDELFIGLDMYSVCTIALEDFVLF